MNQGSKPDFQHASEEAVSSLVQLHPHPSCGGLCAHVCIHIACVRGPGGGSVMYAVLQGRVCRLDVCGGAPADKRCSYHDQSFTTA